CRPRRAHRTSEARYRGRSKSLAWPRRALAPRGASGGRPCAGPPSRKRLLPAGSCGPPGDRRAVLVIVGPGRNGRCVDEVVSDGRRLGGPLEGGSAPGVLARDLTAPKRLDEAP